MNPIWWQYFFRADSIYQVHSPFLFEFLNRISPILESAGAIPILDNEREVQLPEWISQLAEILGIENFSWVPDLRTTSKAYGRLECKIPRRYNNEMIPVGHPGNKSPNPGHIPSFHRFELWTGSIPEEFDHPISPALMMVTNIHQTQIKFQQWQNLVETGNADFTIELYNLGILIAYPVLDHPKHITFIPWQYKPWKAITI